MKHAGLSIVLLAAGVLSCHPDATFFTSADDAAVREVNQRYVDAWLANDADEVLSLFTDDAVLIPHHGDLPVVGIDGIRMFWFNPDYPPSKILEMENTIDEVEGSKNLAFTRGRGRLVYEFDGMTYSNSGNYLNIFKRSGDGWRIYRRTWNDPVARVDD